MRAKRAASGRRRRGRSLVGGLLVGFVIVATAVIWRRGFGVARAKELQELERQRAQLEAERTSLARRIAEGTGRATLGGVAERKLDLHVPTDSQIIVLPTPRGGAK